MRFGILKKFLAAFLAMSLLPLLVLGFYAREKLEQLGKSAVDSNTQALVKTASSLLEARARGIAHQVQVLLERLLRRSGIAGPAARRCGSLPAVLHAPSPPDLAAQRHP
ncbi:MAG: hypothetical protein R6X05_18480 [Desulfobacterales bacterium]